LTPVELTVLGRTLRGRVDEPTARHLRTRWVDAFAPTPGPAVAVVELRRDGRGAPPDGPTVSSGHGIGYRPVARDAFWVFERSAPTSAVRVELSSTGAQLHLAGAPFAGFGALDAALAEALASTGMARLHAAVVTCGTRTLALLGPSGRGKSTTALRAALAGWRIVTEDDCFLDTQSLTVHGAGHEVRLRLDAADRLADSLPFAKTGAPIGDRHPVRFDDVGGRADAAVLTHLVHLTRRRGPVPAWSSMTKAEAVMALLESSGIALTERVQQLHASWFATLVSRLTNMRLDPGPAERAFPDVPDL
jgi:hypothetical protein